VARGIAPRSAGAGRVNRRGRRGLAIRPIA
jgi:hypothetical protein